MNVPVRCYTCGRVLAKLVSQYIQALENGCDNVPKLFVSIGLSSKRICCRRMLLTYVPDVVE